MLFLVFKGLLLYSWRFFRYNAPIHWLVHSHMISRSNKDTASPPNAMSGQHCENYGVKTVHCYQWNVDRCTWSERAVEGGLMSLEYVFQNLLLFFTHLFCYIRNPLMTGPLGNSAFSNLNVSWHRRRSREKHCQLAFLWYFELQISCTQSKTL